MSIGGGPRSAEVTQYSWTDALHLRRARLISGLLTSAFLQKLSASLRNYREPTSGSDDTDFIISVPHEVTVPALRRLWEDVRLRWINSPRCRVDLSNCQFSDVAGLIYLSSLLVQRHRRRLDTVLELPTHPELVHFLKDFEFPELLGEALDLPLNRIIAERSIIQLANPDRKPVRTAGDSARPALPFNYFPLRRISLGRDTRHTDVVRYAMLWQSKHVVAALDRDLDGRGSQIARHVILEALMYASARRRAATALVGAHLGLHHGGTTQLQITFWWDEASAGLSDDSGEFFYGMFPETGYESPAGSHLPVEPTISPQPLWDSEGRQGPATVADSSWGDAREVLALAAEQPEKALRDLAPISAGVTTRTRIPGGLSVLGDAVCNEFGGRLDVYRGRVHLGFGARFGSGPQGVGIELTSIEETYGTLVVVTLPMKS